MVGLMMLWLPILLSSVFVFIASNILWMALPFWHYKDYGRLENDKPVLDALKSVKSGQYIVPFMDWKTMTPEQRQEVQTWPAAFMLVRNPGKFALGKALVSYFLYAVVISVLVAYITGRTRGAGAHYLEVFRIAGAVTFVAYAFRGVPDAIWYGKPWRVVFKELVDGLIFAGLTGGTFGWLWPK